MSRLGSNHNDLLVNLFKGLKSASDPLFVSYIQEKQDRYNEGTDYTVDQLLMLAENKYKELVEAEEWNQPTEEQKKIIALTDQLGKFEKANKDLSKKLKAGNSNNGTKSSKQDHNKRTSKQSNKDKPKYPEWKHQEPGTGDPRSKTVKGKTYYWCKHHKLWTAHKEADCKKGQATPTQDSSNESSHNQGGHLQVNRTLAATIHDDSSI